MSAKDCGNSIASVFRSAYENAGILVSVDSEMECWIEAWAQRSATEFTVLRRNLPFAGSRGYLMFRSVGLSF